MTVAGPVREDLATSSTGRRPVSVKYPVSCWIAAASTMPISTAPIARNRGLKVSACTTSRPSESRRMPVILRQTVGEEQKAATTTSTAENAAEMKKPRLMAAMPERSPGPRGDGEDADHRGDDADRGNDEREGQSEGPEGGRAQDQGGDQRDGIGLEEVGGHARAVTDVVADVVSDRRRVARVVLGDAGLDLADQVGPDIGGLGEDAATDAHEHREQRCPEAEALQDLGASPL